MKILHFMLGFPPYRTGGLTKYSYDLMKAQVKRGDTVLALWPGKMKFISDKVVIHKNKSVDGIENYEIINPLPVSLDEGITEINAFMKPCDKMIFIKFLKVTEPEVIHIHTLMGLYKEFVSAANKLKIRTVFTTHDYFGLCPKVTMYKYGGACEEDHGCVDCIACDLQALSLNKIRLMQSSIYRCLKNFAIVKKLRKNHRNTFFTDDECPKVTLDQSACDEIADRYKLLRGYYIGILSCVDVIHFNSTVAESVYKRFFIPKDSRVISITHQDISDNRRISRAESHKLRLTCLAPAKPFKGYNVIKTALDDLWENGNHFFELKMFSQVVNPSTYMKVQEEGFKYEDLGRILSETDVLLAPSVWYETFGFTVLEAISYGVPVIVSDHVGAKDIIGDGGIIVEAGSVTSLKNAVQSLTKEKIVELKYNVQHTAEIKSWEQFLNENYNLYNV